MHIRANISAECDGSFILPHLHLHLHLISSVKSLDITPKFKMLQQIRSFRTARLHIIETDSIRTPGNWKNVISSLHLAIKDTYFRVYFSFV